MHHCNTSQPHDSLGSGTDSSHHTYAQKVLDEWFVALIGLNLIVLSHWEEPVRCRVLRRIAQVFDLLDEIRGDLK